MRQRLADVEKLLTALTPDQLTALADFEKTDVDKAQQKLVTSGALGDDNREPSRAGDRALRYAVQQIGKPYEWGAEGPKTYDCSGLTSQAWAHAGTPIPERARNSGPTCRESRCGLCARVTW